MSSTPTMSLFILLSLFGFLAIKVESAPTYSFHSCTDTYTFKPNTTYSTNLNLLLSSLTSNASLHDGFLRTSVAPINGLFLCRGDASPALCQDCVAAAADDILRRCPNQTESIIWYDTCLLRYSNQSFNNIVPSVSLQSNTTVASSEQSQFEQSLSDMMNDLKSEANSQTGKKFATKEVNFTSSQTLYGLAQCYPDLSSFDCNMCLESAVAALPSCCSGRKGARVLLPACNIRYEFYLFYNITHTSSSSPPSPPSSSSGKSNISIVVAIVIPIVVALALFVAGCCFLRRRANKKKYTTFKQDDGSGFGAVYKGILPNGHEIAVKRLSLTSLQGALEFRNEAALVAKLQHRNLENPSDRPSMATIALMLNSYSVTLSLPRQPASFMRGRTPNRLKNGVDSDQSSCSIPWSANEASITGVYPR
ncbi:cysteine-rich receptor-like protein kinase 10 [Senna tora]|uniref:Cysteine-rich receptor-like protein kinase 10 n=1 Tax=Senna tora TaxID=362788 RepID=A0A834X9R5_9FABA|nr:cysteine-rich receptor-like protein kinase 10 [Senna tora]